MIPDAFFTRLHDIEDKLIALERRVDELCDTVDVMQERTCDHESRLEDIETWQETVEDELDEY